jgi:uncharacterized protein YprB with RNaseH-like and TPR domain
VRILIIRQNNIEVGDINSEEDYKINNRKEILENSLFFDLEHYIYKKPICVGVFGCCYFNKEKHKICVTQYMIENEKDSIEILYFIKDYFYEMIRKYKKKYIITFSGNNDFTVIKYLFNKYNISCKVLESFVNIDLQKKYEKQEKVSIGLKALEKKFNILRKSEVLSGQNLAKTFGRIVKDSDYINRMPNDKKERILLYNEQDVVSLFYIYLNWDKVLNSQLIGAN